MSDSTFSANAYEQAIEAYIEEKLAPFWRKAITEENRRRKEVARNRKRTLITGILVLCVCVIGVAAVLLWNYNQPINVYNRAIGRNPNDTEAYYKRGQLYNEKNEYDQAVADFTQVITLDPNHVAAYNSRGQIYDEKKEYDQAVADFTQVITLDPDHVAAYNSRGRIYIIKNDHKRAIEDLDASLKLHPEDPKILEARALVWEKLGVLIWAVVDWEKALKLDPGNSNYQTKLTNVKAKVAEYEKEITNFTAALRRNPSDAAAYNSRGWRYYLIGYYQKALEDSTTSLKLRPNHASTLDTRASAYQGLGNLDRAVADWQAAMRLEPKNAEFKDKLEKTMAGIDIRPDLMEMIKNIPRDGTYTFSPRLVGTKGGNAAGGWLAKIVIHDGLMDLFLASAATGKGRKNGLSFGPPSTLTLKDLDNPSKNNYNAIQNARWDENTGAWIVTFRNVTSKRLTYIETQPNPNWIIREIILKSPD